METEGVSSRDDDDDFKLPRFGGKGREEVKMSTYGKR